eukprot:8719305-Alexandrium_andersonii.AAC.1
MCLARRAPGGRPLHSNGCTVAAPVSTPKRRTASSRCNVNSRTAHHPQLPYPAQRIAEGLGQGGLGQLKFASSKALHLPSSHGLGLGLRGP